MITKKTLLSFSPSPSGSSVLSDWKPALMLCMRLLSFELAMALRTRFSSTQFSSDSCEEQSPNLRPDENKKQNTRQQKTAKRTKRNPARK